MIGADILEVLYAPYFGNGDCGLQAVVILALTAAIGALTSTVFWLALWKSPYRPRYLPTVAVGSSLLFLFGVYLYYTVEERMVRVATDWHFLEYRYCKKSDLFVELHPLSTIAAKRYRRDVQTRSNGRKTTSHYLDLYITERPVPISISLDALRSEVNLTSVKKFAPSAVEQYLTSLPGPNS